MPPLRTADEIGVLYDSFNYMVNQIKAHTTALEESKASLVEAQRIAHLGNWEWDIVENETSRSDEVYHIFGLSPREFDVTHETFLNCIHPDDRELVKKSVHDALYEKKPYEIDHRILCRDGSLRFVHEKAEVAFDAHGKAIRMTGTVQDITERKRSEEEINLLRNMTIAIAEAPDFHSALRVALQKVCESTGWIYGEAWFPSSDGKYLEHVVSWYNPRECLEEFEKKSKEFIFSPGLGLPGRVWLSKKPEWKRDATSDGYFPRAAIARKYGLKAALGIPVILNEEVVAILDFFVREQHDEDERLVKTVSSVAAQLGAVIRRKQAEDALQDSEEKLRAIIDNTTAVIFVKDLQHRYLLVNKQYEKLFHINTSEIAGKTDHEQFPKEIADKLVENDKKIIETKRPLEFEEVVNHDDGLHTYIAVKFPLLDSHGIMYAICGIATDITERKRSEEEKEKLRDQLYHSQRLEAVGKLAGGIAHDFNNILTAIIGYGNLLLLNMKEDSTPKMFVQRILTSAERAAQLTQGLLAFSRKQISNPVPINLNEIIKREEHLLVRLIREDIKLKIELINKDCTVMADTRQTEQILMNLVTNARDAMPNGGTLTIQTDILEADKIFIKIVTHDKSELVGFTSLAGAEKSLEKEPKRWYVCLSVSDTGMGMDKQTQMRVFEPFFTTKEVGKGTGLGLAIIYGIIMQHNGYIDVESEPGKGTTFRVYLPFIESKAEEIKPVFLAEPAGGNETILLAEDEEEVRRLTKTVLENAGYTVIEAVNGMDAINKFTLYRDKIRLLVLDVIMPEKNGKEAYDSIKELQPDIKAIFMSGYSENMVHKKGIIKKGLHYISKPLTPTDLLRKVREVLDG
ncbi:MAG: PAS domain S-box protein [Candidatus Brocadiaceae bacterium]